ncbi:hypothetical protein ACHAXT_010535 [Thalassiosira profunda]
MTASVEEADDLQRFIADCEFKTRKILRESNKRLKDNARSLAAKERLDQLKHGSGTPTKPGGSVAKASSPLAKSKRLNVSSPHNSPGVSTAKQKLSPTPVKEWKGRDRIIHDAYETIKSLPVDKKPLTSPAPRGSQPAENVRAGIHSSLSASPFCGAKSISDSVAKPKPKGKLATPKGASGAAASPENAEPALITRRTIERDFYIMSKKRSNPSKRRQMQQQQNDPAPELKTSVLRKKYRCDERIMKAKKKKAERAYERLKRLKLPTDESEVNGDEGDDSGSSISSSDEEEEERGHAIYDLVERHIEYENARSLKRANKLLAKRTFTPNVKEFWAHLQQGNGDLALEPSRDAAMGDSDSLEEVGDISGRAGPAAMVIDQGPFSRYICPYNEPGVIPPLSMRVSGCSPYVSTVCPGHAPIGKRGVWRLLEPAAEEVNKDVFPVWPALEDIKYPAALDSSQATGYFRYRNLGPKKGDCVTVLNSLAFESPVLAPDCLAIDKGYISPPFAEHEPVTGVVPYVHLPGTHLMANPLESRLDALLPPPVVVVDPGASEGDWNDAPTDEDGRVYHLRGLDERDGDGFRVTTSANVVEYDDSISRRVYGISESAASPNRPVPSPLVAHTSHEACTHSLIRVRTAADYHYIAKSEGEGTLGEPYLFSTHMSAYKSVFVSRKSVSSYREQEKFLHATKEAERKKLELALKMKAAEELVEARLKERIARIERSVHKASEVGGTSDHSVAVDHPTANLPDAPTHADKIPADVELLPVPTPSLEEEKADGTELEQLASLLLKDANFLKAVARKLNISEDQVAQIDAAGGEAKAIANAKGSDGEPSSTLEARAERVALHPTSAVNTPAPLVEPASMPKLKLNCKRYRDTDRVSSRGDGWKRLPRSETIIGDFSLTKRNVQRGIGGPKHRKLDDDGRKFIAVDAVEALQHESDPQQFEVEPRSLFIPDLTTERLQLARTYRQQKKTKESMLSLAQQQSLNEILKIPVAEPAQKPKEEGAGEEGSDLVAEEVEGESIEEKVRPRDHISRAILAVKNHNLSDLEEILDAQGLSVETRDHHGNTLFVLACQQGSKKLAKFLLRRGAHINAQNNGGNTALHYLYEYKHVALAEYLVRKGADDSIKNAEGLTVYEGTQLNSMFGR